MDETQTDYMATYVSPMLSRFFALDRARNVLIELVEDVSLTSDERRYLAHWLRMGEVQELEVLASLLEKFRALQPR